jgi:hypothetical protein
MLSSKLVISIVAVVVVSVVVIGGVVLIRPSDHTAAPSEPIMDEQTRKFFSGKAIHSTPKGY